MKSYEVHTREGASYDVLEYSPEDREKAMTVSLTALATSLGYTPERIGNHFRLKEMDSLVIYNDKSWHRWSGKGTRTGGSQIDFMLEFGGLSSVPEAIQELLIFQGETSVVTQHISEQNSQAKGGRSERMVMPPKNSSYKRLYAYLMQTRGLSQEVVSDFVKRKLIYEDSVHHNIVYCGYDPQGNIRYAGLRGTADIYGKKFKMDVLGNDKNYGVSIVNKDSSKLKVFESVIDCMSYIDLTGDTVSNKLILGMVEDNPLVQFLKDYNHIKDITFCLDNDYAAKKALYGDPKVPEERRKPGLVQKYTEAGYGVDVEVPRYGKDYNETLIAVKHKAKNSVSYEVAEMEYLPWGKIHAGIPTIEQAIEIYKNIPGTLHDEGNSIDIVINGKRITLWNFGEVDVSLKNYPKEIKENKEVQRAISILKDEFNSGKVLEDKSDMTFQGEKLIGQSIVAKRDFSFGGWTVWQNEKLVVLDYYKAGDGNIYVGDVPSEENCYCIAFESEVDEAAVDGKEVEGRIVSEKVFKDIFRIMESTVEKELREEQERPLTAENITNIKGIDRQYDAGNRETTYTFECDIQGVHDTLTYNISQHDYGNEDFSIHTKNNDVWERMKKDELEKLEGILSKEANFFIWQQRIADAKTIADLQDIQDWMGEIVNPNLFLSSEQWGKLYEMIEEKENFFSEETKEKSSKETNFKIQPLSNNEGFIVRSDSERFGENAIVFQGINYGECLGYIKERTGNLELSYYVIKDLSTWARNLPKEQRSELERFTTVEEAVGKFNEYLAMEYLKEEVINPQTNEPMRRLTMGVSTGNKEMDLLHTENDKVLLISDIISERKNGYEWVMANSNFIQDLNKIVSSVKIDEYSHYRPITFEELVNERIAYLKKYYPETENIKENAEEFIKRFLKNRPNYQIQRKVEERVVFEDFNPPFLDKTEKKEKKAMKSRIPLEELLEEKPDYSFDYQLLSRLKSDCDYYTGYMGKYEAHRADNHLWAGNVPGQIAKMREIYEYLPEKPEWLTEQDIDDYEKRMTDTAAFKKVEEALTTLKESALQAAESGSIWGAWFGRVANSDKPQDYIELDLLGVERKKEVIVTANIIRNNEIVKSDSYIIDASNMLQYGDRREFTNENGFFEEHLREELEQFDITPQTAFEFYSPDAKKSLEEHYKLLKRAGFDTMPLYKLEQDSELDKGKKTALKEEIEMPAMEDIIPLSDMRAIAEEEEEELDCIPYRGR